MLPFLDSMWSKCLLCVHASSRRLQVEQGMLLLVHRSKKEKTNKNRDNDKRLFLWFFCPKAFLLLHHSKEDEIKKDRDDDLFLTETFHWLFCLKAILAAMATTATFIHPIIFCGDINKCWLLLHEGRVSKAPLKAGWWPPNGSAVAAVRCRSVGQAPTGELEGAAATPPPHLRRVAAAGYRIPPGGLGRRAPPRERPRPTVRAGTWGELRRRGWSRTSAEDSDGEFLRRGRGTGAGTGAVVQWRGERGRWEQAGVRGADGLRVRGRGGNGGSQPSAELEQDLGRPIASAALRLGVLERRCESLSLSLVVN